MDVLVATITTMALATVRQKRATRCQTYESELEAEVSLGNSELPSHLRFDAPWSH